MTTQPWLRCIRAGLRQQVSNALHALVRCGRIPRARPGLGRYQAGCSWLEQIEKREDKNPDKIDKVPEQSADFDAISQVLWIALIKLFADWQPHINENEDAGEHVGPVQSGDGEITGEIRAVPRAE